MYHVSVFACLLCLVVISRSFRLSPEFAAFKTSSNSLMGVKRLNWEGKASYLPVSKNVEMSNALILKVSNEDPADSVYQRPLILTHLGFDRWVCLMD